MTKELRRLEEHISGPQEGGMTAETAQQGSSRQRYRLTASASRSTANRKDSINTDQDVQQATRQKLEQLVADLPTWNQDLPCKSAAQAVFVEESPPSTWEGRDGPQSNRHI